jgi:hypothetical protein
MSLTTTDILNIQSAIDSYEKQYPLRPSPSAAEALAWQAGKHAEKWSNQDSKLASDEAGPISWAWQSILFWWTMRASPYRDEG